MLGKTSLMSYNHIIETFRCGKVLGVRQLFYWAQHSERPTKYFLNLEKKRSIEKLISAIKKNDGVLTTNFQDVMNTIRELIRGDVKIHNSWLQPKCYSIQQLCIAFPI